LPTVSKVSGIFVRISQTAAVPPLRKQIPVYPKLKKGKTIPLQVWTGPEGSRKLRLPGFKTTGT
jgi:hypothetical protein